MQQNPPPQLPSIEPEPPAGPAGLPGSVSVRRLTVPEIAPPYDDEPQPLTGPLASADTGGTGSPGAGDGGHGDGGHGAGDDGHGDGRPGSGSPGSGWASQFAQVLAETLAGSRPQGQLAPWTTEQARRRIRQLGPMLVTDQRPRVRRVLTSAPGPDVLEMTAVVGFGSQVRALAIRLERDGASPRRPGADRWYCTAIESA